MHEPTAKVGEWLRSVLRGYYQYHAVLGNLAALFQFRHRVVRHWYGIPCQRSQRRQPGRSWVRCSTTGCPLTWHIRTPMLASTPDALRRGVHGKNRMQ